MDEMQGQLEIWLQGVKEPVVLLYRTQLEADDAICKIYADITDENNKILDVLFCMGESPEPYFCFRSSLLVAMRASRIVR
jgi:hypothetical protein